MDNNFPVFSDPPPHEYVVFTRAQLKGNDWREVAAAAAAAQKEVRLAGKKIAIIDDEPGWFNDLPRCWSIIASRIILGGIVIKDRFITVGTRVVMDDKLRTTGHVTRRLKSDDAEKIKEVATRIYHGSEEAIEFADKPAYIPLSLSEDEVPDCWHCGERPKDCRCDGGVGP